MPNVFLTAAELKGRRELPRCCVVCGRSKARLVRASFMTQAGRDEGPFSSSDTVMHRLTASVPLCSRHRNYFSGIEFRGLIIGLGALAFFAFMLVVAACAGASKGGNASFVIVPIVMVGFAVLFGVVGLLSYSSKQGVHASYIDLKGMRLENVSRGFADALAHYREQAGPEEIPIFLDFSDDDDPPRRKRRRRSRDDYDDEDDYDRRRRRRERG